MYILQLLTKLGQGYSNRCIVATTRALGRTDITYVCADLCMYLANAHYVQFSAETWQLSRRYHLCDLGVGCLRPKCLLFAFTITTKG